MNTDKALSVSQLNNYIKTLMECDDVLNYVTLRGEISNFKLHSSGHAYFTLKDQYSEIAAVMFRSSAARLDFHPKSGDKVVAYGKVSVYEASGKYQLYVSAMKNDGAGALYAEYLRLLELLRSEGLFDESRKKPIPRFPRKVGIITSPTGAAVRDMINVTGRRFPCADLLICPSAVQGAEAPAELCRALSLLDAAGECDVIIIGRGGGSAEDLWAFNNEAVVRAVAGTRTPIISAVGHETDTTLCDFAADMRAPTPSAAAELAVPDRAVLMQNVDELLGRADSALRSIIERRKSTVEDMKKKIMLGSPESRIKLSKEKIASGERIIDERMQSILRSKKILLASAAGKLDAVNPLAVLARGYGVVKGPQDRVVSSVDDVELGSTVHLLVKDGDITATVTDKEYISRG